MRLLRLFAAIPFRVRQDERLNISATYPLRISRFLAFSLSRFSPPAIIAPVKQSLPHKLALYRAAVQHPPAEVAFLERAYRHYHRRDPLLLKEDFAGSAAISMVWVASSDEHQAIAIDSHAPTVRWASKQTALWLGDRADDLHLVHADVMSLTSPKVDVVAALNFSALIYHDRAALLAYFRNARKSLAPAGIFVIDIYGGPGALRPQSQHRQARTEDGLLFDYCWEQRKVNAVTGRVENHIHFTFDDGRAMRSAFRYDWRLWSLPELLEIMHAAGFAKAQVWCDKFDAKTGQSDGTYRPTSHIEPREDWVAYVIGVKK